MISSNASAAKNILFSYFPSQADTYVLLGSLLPGVVLLLSYLGFIREVLAGTKELVPLSKVPSLFVPPRISQFKVETIFEQVKDDQRIMRFLPSSSRQQDKAYFFAVLSAVVPDFYNTILNAVKEQRKQLEPESEKIMIIPEMQELIERNTPYLGQEQKIGKYLKIGRQWGRPTPKEKQNLDIRRLF